MAFYIFAQFLNVVLSTIKSVITIKGTKEFAAVFSAINYGVNAFVIKTTTEVSVLTAILVAVICNLVGVYLGLWITEKFRKETLWKISVTIPTEQMENFKKELVDNQVDFVAMETSWDKFKVVDIYSAHKEKSKKIKEIFKHYDVKYTIATNNKSL